MKYDPIPVTDQEIQMAKELTKEINNQWSIRQDRWHGKLAEIKFHQLYPQCQWSDTKEYDFITPLGIRVNVKCESGISRYGSNNRLQIPSHQKKYKTDLYYFTRYLFKEKIMEMYGAIRSDVYWELAELSPKGSPLPHGNIREWDTYLIRGYVFEKHRIETFGDNYHITDVNETP